MGINVEHVSEFKCKPHAALIVHTVNIEHPANGPQQAYALIGPFSDDHCGVGWYQGSPRCLVRPLPRVAGPGGRSGPIQGRDRRILQGRDVFQVHEVLQGLGVRPIFGPSITTGGLSK